MHGKDQKYVRSCGMKTEETDRSLGLPSCRCDENFKIGL